jgi:predicted permease
MTVDSSLLWVGAGLAIVAAVLLAFVPRLPSAEAAHGLALTSSGVRITSGTNRRLRVFAVTQIAASFMLVAGAGMLVRTLLTLQAARPGFETQGILAVDVPVTSFGRTPEQTRTFYREVQRRIRELPGVEQVAVGSNVPWRDTGGNDLSFSVDGRARADGQEDPRAKFRSVSPGFFASLGIPMRAGRDFSDADGDGGERVVIISQSLAARVFPGQDPLNRHLMWTDGIVKFIGVSVEPRRIVGVVADIDDENIDPVPALVVYHPFEQEIGGGRVFVHASTDPYALVPAITRTIRELAGDQPVERAAALDDIRAEVLAPTRLNAIVFGGFAIVALVIAVVGVAGVLAFSVSGRTREFGIRLAMGSQPRNLLAGVLREGMLIAAIGIVAGAAGGFVLARVAASYIQDVQIPGALPVLAAAVVLLAAAVIASVLPAGRAARVDVVQALRAE